MKCGCVFVSGQRLCVPPSVLSWSVNLAQCRHVTPSSDQQHIVIFSMEDVFFIIVQIFLSLSIVAGIALDMRQHQYSNIEYVHESWRFFSSENITPDAYPPRPQNTKQFQMSHFHLMIFYSEAVVILKSTHHFQFYTSWVSDVLRSLYMLQFKTAQCICIFTWWSIVSVDMIVICCHELEHDQTWLIFSMTI